MPLHRNSQIAVLSEQGEVLPLQLQKAKGQILEVEYNKYVNYGRTNL